MMTFDLAPFRRRLPLLGLAALLLLAAILSAALAGTGLAGAQDDGLSVSATANPPNPEVDVPVLFSATISNPPAGAEPSYRWELYLGDDDWMYTSGNSTFSYVMASPGSTTVRLMVSYDSGDSATSEPLTVEWTKPEGYTPIPTAPPPTPTPTPTGEPTPAPSPEPEPTATPAPEPTAAGTHGYSRAGTHGYSRAGAYAYAGTHGYSHAEPTPLPPRNPRLLPRRLRQNPRNLRLLRAGAHAYSHAGTHA